MFVDRLEEKSVFEGEYGRLGEQASLMVVYGRRRAGKTSLVTEFLKEKKGIYFLATLQPEAENAKSFSAAAARFFGDSAVAQNPFADWDGFFEYLVREVEGFGKPLVLAFDEFTYLVQQNRAFPSILQKYWDTKLAHLPIMLVLSGSYVGMTEREILSYKAPLYGRARKTIHLGEMSFPWLSHFLPNYALEELVGAYAAAGGSPAYLLAFDAKKPLKKNFPLFFDKTSFLHNDAEALLRDELREPRTYFSLLKAIAFGRNSLKEASDYTGLPPFTALKYLSVLRGLGLIERRVPVTEKNPEKSRRGAYLIGDNYYSFWMRFVQPNLDRIETRTVPEYLESKEFKQDFQTYTGRIFEKICMQHFRWLNSSQKLGFTRVGNWWNRQGEEIDFIALGDGKAAFAECKWTNRPLTEMDAMELQEKAEKTGLDSVKKTFFLYSRSGFTPQAADALKGLNAKAFSEKQLMEWINAEAPKRQA